MLTGRRAMRVGLRGRGGRRVCFGRGRRHVILIRESAVRARRRGCVRGRMEARFEERLDAIAAAQRVRHADVPGDDRSNRQKTGEARVPHGTFKTAADALAAFRKLRSTMNEYAKSTSDDLRARKLLEGNMDVYQWFLMISSHSQRHILQIREIKGHAGFPKA